MDLNITSIEKSVEILEEKLPEISNENILKQRTTDILKMLIKLSIDIGTIKSDIITIKNDISYIKNNMNIQIQPPTIFEEVDKQIDKEFIIEMLNSASILCDLKIISSIYLPENEPISIKYDKNVFLYWDGDSWIKNEQYFLKKIIKKISLKYLSVNIFDNYEHDISKLINNQKYIDKLNSRAYILQLKKKLINILE